MKSFVCLTLFFVMASVATASSVGSSTSSISNDSKKDVDSDLKPSHNSQVHNDNDRFRKSASYGGSYGVSAPPCPRNYLFSCQPNLAPAPCSPSAHSYGSVGAYSAPVPSYVAPIGNNYGLPQGYAGFVPQSYNQFYEY